MSEESKKKRIEKKKEKKRQCQVDLYGFILLHLLVDLFAHI